MEIVLEPVVVALMVTSPGMTPSRALRTTLTSWRSRLYLLLLAATFQVAGPVRVSTQRRVR
jgi:hypothetical protein